MTTLLPAPRALQLDAHRLGEELHAAHVDVLTSVLSRLRLHAPPALVPAAVTVLHHASFLLSHPNTDDGKMVPAPPAAALFGMQPVSATGTDTLVALSAWRRLALVAIEAAMHASQAIPRLSSRLSVLRATVALIALVAALRNPLCVPRPAALLAGVRYVVPSSASTTAPASADLLDRQLLLSAAADIALAVLPALRFIARSLLLRPSLRRLRSRIAAVGDDGNDDGDGNNDGLSLSQNPNVAVAMPCVLCGTSPVMPHALVPCRCVACYVCVASSPPPACPRCGAAVVARARLTFG